MSNKTTAELLGEQEFLKALTQMGSRAKKSMVGINRAGAKQIKKAADANAAAITSKSNKPTALRVRMRTAEGYAVGSIFPKKGFAHLRLFEYGTKAGWRWARKNGPFQFYVNNGMGNKLVVTRLIKHPGLKQRKWLEPAFDSARNAAIAAVSAEVVEVIEHARTIPEGSDE